jgi:hypothetical protein
MLGRSKAIQNFDHHCRITSKIHRFIDRMNHQFLNRSKQNAKYELDIFFTLLQCDGTISKYQYIDTLFLMSKVKQLLIEWKDTIGSDEELSLPNTLSKQEEAEEEEQQLVGSPPATILRKTELKGKISELMSPTKGSVARRLDFSSTVLHEDYFSQKSEDSPTSPVSPVRLQPKYSQSDNVKEQSQSKSIFRSLLGAFGGTSSNNDATQQQRGKVKTPERSTKSSKSNNSSIVSQLASADTVTHSSFVKRFKHQQGSAEQRNDELIVRWTEHREIFTNSSTQIKHALKRTDLYRWLSELLARCISKFHLYFYSALFNSIGVQEEFQRLHKLVRVDYYSWIESYYNNVSPMCVCIIQHTERVTSMTDRGYNLKISLSQQEQNEKLSGLKSYPCIFSYPQQVCSCIYYYNHTLTQSID